MTRIMNCAAYSRKLRRQFPQRTLQCGGWQACTYDNNGNITSDGTCSFSYDDENQLTSVSSGTTYRHDFIYDGLGRKRKRPDYARNGRSWAVNAEVRCLCDGRNVIDERFGDNTPTVACTRGWNSSSRLEGAGGIGGMLAHSHG